MVVSDRIFDASQSALEPARAPSGVDTSQVKRSATSLPWLSRDRAQLRVR